MIIKTNMNKARVIAHNKRRASRAEAFKPLDIKATIPSEAMKAEKDRQAIRDADALKQIAIDTPNITEAELKELM